MRLREDGDLAARHPDFNGSVIGSLTIWPYRVAGERFGLNHWVWWSQGPIWLSWSSRRSPGLAGSPDQMPIHRAIRSGSFGVPIGG